MGILQYSQDADENMPLYYICGATTACGPYGWADSIQPYMKSYQALQCPSDDRPLSSSPSSTNYVDYAYHLWLGGYRVTASVNISAMPMAVLTKPSLSVMLTDIAANGSGGGTASSYVTACYPSYNSCGEFRNSTQIDTGLAYLRNSVRHLGGTNLGFVDGHAKWFKADETTERLASVYSAGTPGTVSGENATFNPKP